MRNLYTRKRSKIYYLRFLLYAVGAVILLCLFDTIYLILYILILVLVIEVAYLHNAGRRTEKRIFRSMNELSDKRLVVIRKLIDLSYTYECDKSLFFEKFRESVSIEILRRERIVDMGPYQTQENNHENKLSPEDAEMCCLIVNGFTPRELSVLYGLKNPRSIYVKRHRLKNKMHSL